MKLEIKGLERLNELQTSLKDKRAQKAVRRTLHKTAVTTKAEAQKMMKSQYAMKLSASDLKKMIHVNYGETGELAAEISVKKERGLSLIKVFGATPTKKGVKARILKASPKRVMGKPKRRAFIMRPKKGGEFVAVRRSAVRMDIRKLSGPPLSQIFNKHLPKLAETWAERAEKVLQQELNYAFKVEK